MASMVDMKVAGLTVDPLTNLPVLILTDAAGRLALPIGIGRGEAPAIASELSKVALQRPVAHDLMKTILGQCGVKVDRVELRSVRRETVYASIFLDRRGRQGCVEIDARPSDAIALALRTGAPIRVARKVIEKARAERGADEIDRLELAACGGDPEDLVLVRDGLPLLETLAEEDFGKWKM